MPSEIKQVLKGYRGCCNATEKKKLTEAKKTILVFNPQNVSKIAFTGLLETNIYSRVTIRVTQLFTFLRRILGKNLYMRNTGQGERLKTICPEIFFYILTGGRVLTRSVFMVFKVIAHRKIWRCFNALICLQHCKIWRVCFISFRAQN